VLATASGWQGAGCTVHTGFWGVPHEGGLTVWEKDLENKSCNKTRVLGPQHWPCHAAACDHKLSASTLSPFPPSVRARAPGELFCILLLLTPTFQRKGARHSCHPLVAACGAVCVCQQRGRKSLQPAVGVTCATRISALCPKLE